MTLHHETPSKPFAGRVVAITGAGGGLGAALARRFGRAGASLALLDLEPPRALAEVLLARGAPAALPLACDVTDPSACRAAVAATRAALGGVDVLVNNAGITHRSQFAENRLEVLRRVMEVNFFGSVHATEAALASLRERRGLVVAISSVAGFAPLLGRTGYAASKHALEGFMKTLRCEVAPDGVDVLLVRPGFVDTPLARSALNAAGRVATHAQAPVGRPMPPAVAADAVVEAAARRQRDLVLTPVARASWWLSHLAPRAYDALMTRSQRSERSASTT